MRRLSFLLLALAVAGCSTGQMNTDNDLQGDLRLNAGALSADQTIVENAMTQPELSTLVAAVQRADLVSALNGPGPYTVFAPIDPAWTMDLGEIDDDQLADVLTYHVVEGDYRSTELTDGMTLETLNGEELTIQTLQNRDPMMKVDDADIVYADIESSNGRVHLINLVLDPTRGSGAQ
ncbi:fasciclin domain-containing protein [Rubrivirga marina]|nr:fasciclin domain-containing protein [Rubrivirga marina]